MVCGMSNSSQIMVIIFRANVKVVVSDEPVRQRCSCTPCIACYQIQADASTPLPLCCDCMSCTTGPVLAGSSHIAVSSVLTSFCGRYEGKMDVVLTVPSLALVFPSCVSPYACCHCGPRPSRRVFLVYQPGRQRSTRMQRLREDTGQLRQ